MDDEKLNASEYNKKMSNLRADMDTFSFKVEMTQKETLHMKEFLRVYLPIKIQSVVSECLRGVLDRKYLKRLDHFENEKIPELRETLLVPAFQ
jgi:hypothetical protein